ncbi:cytochrome b [Vibrio maritimus]|uniref:Cytochrome b n=1 Tax=Vibrio maritimus TaxID=990268 RepID=A0A090RQX6_9VIBR|nr:cytochrome b [Vibrio maritimus]
MRKIKIWDLSTRLYHWAQALIFFGLMATGITSNGPHVQLGLALFTLIVWRILWGLVGSETSRFSQFVRNPLNTVRYALGKSTSYIGHNPLGALMVITMLTTLLVQCLTGMMLAGLFDGLEAYGLIIPDALYEISEEVHILLADLLPIIIATHVGAIVIYKILGKGLLKAMITGYQSLDFNQSVPVLSSQIKALVVLIFAILVTMTIVATSNM